MASRIQIKRATDATVPTSSDIQFGELAYSAAGSSGSGVLYTLDASTNTRVIGGDKYMAMLDHTAGTLTGSSAIITDASSKVNQLLTTNITVGATNLTFGSAADMIIPENNAAALQICDGAVNLMTFDTTTGSANVSFGSALSSSALTATTGEPVVTIKSTATSNADGDRPSTIDFKGGDNEILGRMKVSHDGTADDNKGQLRIYTNDGSDAANPDLAVEINSAQVTCFLGDVEVGSGAGASAKNLKVWGDLTVEGATTTINTAQLTVEDDLITVSKGNDTHANADGSGVEIDVSGAEANIHWKYVHANTAWSSNIDIDIATAKDYKINATSVLNSTTLGGAVVNSSLTKVGVLNEGSINTGFGDINNGTNNITSGGIWKVNADYVNANDVGSLNFGAGGGATDANMGYDGTDFKFNVVSGSLDISATGAVDFSAPDMTLLDANNNGNPTFTMGSSATNALIITANYDTGAQTLDNVTYATPTANNAANKGKHVFSVDGTSILEIRDNSSGNGLYATTADTELNNFKVDGGTFG